MDALLVPSSGSLASGGEEECPATQPLSPETIAISEEAGPHSLPDTAAGAGVPAADDLRGRAEPPNAGVGDAGGGSGGAAATAAGAPQRRHPGGGSGAEGGEHLAVKRHAGQRSSPPSPERQHNRRRRSRSHSADRHHHSRRQRSSSRHRHNHARRSSSRSRSRKRSPDPRQRRGSRSRSRDREHGRRSRSRQREHSRRDGRRRGSSKGRRSRSPRAHPLQRLRSGSPSPGRHEHRHARRSHSRSRSPPPRTQQQQQQQVAEVAAAPASPRGRRSAEDLLRSGSGGASMVVKLRIRGSPGTPCEPLAQQPVAGAGAAGRAAAAEVVLPEAGKARLEQPSPASAATTVAALAALQRGRPAHESQRAGPSSNGGVGPREAPAMAKPRLSFADDLEEEGEDGDRPGSRGMSSATAKRFKHEKTLVLLNPSMGPQSHPLPLHDDDEPLPMSPSSSSAPLSLGSIVWGTSQAKGLRPYMEDRHTIVAHYQPHNSMGAPIRDGVMRAYAAVFDGHNGASAAEHATDRMHHILAAEPALRTCTGEGPPAAQAAEETRLSAALVHSFEATDREILMRSRLEGSKGGATALVVLRVGEQLYAAHAGDTRAVLSRNRLAVRLTEDHKPNLPRERKRVEGVGGRVDFARCWRVIVEPGGGRPASGLAVSRSLGDIDFKEPLHLVTATPDVMRERLRPGDSFVILASDGLWDVMTDEEACSVVEAHLEARGAFAAPGGALGGGGPPLSAALAASAAEALLQTSMRKGTMDNVTTVVGLLQWG